MGRRFGFNVWLWGLNELVGDDINANFVSLAEVNSTAPTQGTSQGQYWVVYGLKPERVPIQTADGLNNSINNMDMYFQQFTIMLKAMKNTDHWNMVNYRRMQGLFRKPFKYFTYFNPPDNSMIGDNNVTTGFDPMFLDNALGKPPVPYFDMRDIPINHAMRFEVVSENIKHDFKDGTKIMEIKIQCYKPTRSA